MAQDKAVMQKVRQAAYETACHFFSPQRHAEAFASFFREALHRHVTSLSTYSEPLLPRNDPECASNPTSDTAMRLLIRGEWHWKNGTDQVLRALTQVSRIGKLRLIFKGIGPQEDELRYLVRFLGVDGIVRILRDEPSLKNETKAQNMETRLVLDIANAQNQGWCLLQEGHLIARVSFGDLEMLKNCIFDLTQAKVG